MPLLILKDERGKHFQLRRFDHDCQIIWSPDSTHLAITDWQASDRSDIFVYSVTQPSTGKSLGRLLPRTAIPAPERDGHCYFEAVRWLDGHRLQIKVSGHRDEVPATSFAHDFVFDLLSGKFQAVVNVKGR